MRKARQAECYSCGADLTAKPTQVIHDMGRRGMRKMTNLRAPWRIQLTTLKDGIQTVYWFCWDCQDIVLVISDQLKETFNRRVK